MPRVTSTSTIPKLARVIINLLLIAATDANLFADPVPSILNAPPPGDRKKMLAMRMGERVNLFAETGRRDGLVLAPIGKTC